MSFDPSQPQGNDSQIFGLEDKSDVKINLLGIPWDATASYKKGAADGPEHIFQASKQLDLFDLQFGNIWEKGIRFDLLADIYDLNRQARSFYHEKQTGKLNELSLEMNAKVYKKTSELLKKNKFVGLLGGEHSIPYGFLQAINEKYSRFSLLHLDAHADLRTAYEGHLHSHASIFFNTVKDFKSLDLLLQVGIRDLSENEYNFAKTNPKIFMDDWFSIQKKLRENTFESLVDSWISKLSENVYISFDIDAMDARFCPNTGTPVPGGFDFDQICFLLEKLKFSGKKIIGFDLCEVAPSEDQENEWNGNVGARVLYKLCGLVN